MTSMLRILVVCLGVIALPVHGWAATGLCAAGGAAQGAVEVHVHVHPHVHSGAGHDAPSGDDASTHAALHAACCAASFLADSSPRTPDRLAVPTTRFPVEAVAFAVVTLDLLDRPPDVHL